MVTSMVHIRTTMTYRIVPPTPLRVAEDVLPIASFKARASEVARTLRRNQRPMIVTQNGKPAMVLLSPEEYDRLTYRARFLEAIGEGLADSEAGRVVSDAELRKRLDAKFGKLPR
jgi:prevent-host-death family protein